MRVVRTVLISTTIALVSSSMPGRTQGNPRFVDNLDGTISDKSTGLMWEKKSPCETANTADPHCVKNTYEWTKSGSEPDGSLFTDFLAILNRAGSGGKYADWRIPTIEELKRLADCGEKNCLDPVFGETQAFRYWSSSPYAESREQAWTLNFLNGAVNFRLATNSFYVRAVRSGR